MRRLANSQTGNQKKGVEKNLALRLLQLIFSQRQYFAEVLLHINLRGGLYLLKAGIRDE